MKKLIYLLSIVLISSLALTGCSVLSDISQVPTTDQSGITYLTKGTEALPESFPLYAGQDNLVGQVLVWDNGLELCVEYQLSPEAIAEGWLIYETHLEAATEVGLIPQKNGNPPPGKFRYGNDDLVGVESWQDCIPFEDILGVDGDLCSDSIVIAAHAVIEKTECEITVEAGSDFFVSDTDTMVVAGNVGGAVYPKNAVLAHKPGDAGSPYPPVWDTNLTRAFDVAAEWIWESLFVVNPIAGDVVTFEKQFEVPGIPAGGTLYVACDNGFAVELNGVLLGSYNLFQYPNLGDLKQPYVNTADWWNVQQYDLTANLIQGTNTLTIVGVNEYLYPDDVDKVGNAQITGDGYYNPGGVIFEFDVAWDEFEECTTYDESAWGAVSEGLNPFPGKNWATYFNYDVEAVPVDTTWILTFEYEGSDYDHEMLLTNTCGVLTGTGGYPVGGPYTYPWTITSGNVIGNEIDFHAIYGPICPPTVAGATMHLTGTITSPGTITNGSWTDNAWLLDRSGTWTAVLVP